MNERSLILAVLAAASFAVLAAPQTQRSEAGGVTVAVTPPDFSKPTTWDFDVTLETHTQNLNDDLAQASTLYGDGKTYRPLGWKGAPPGGHHRKGVLSFKAIDPPPRTVELRIDRAGEPASRVFPWQLR